MQSSLFLVLRRIRAPLILLIVIYAVSITGLVFIPGADGEGNPIRMDFLHAFYFISYTATTIGFGEIPYAFTPAQRLWVTFCIYLTVIGWSYAFVKVLALVQDRWFLHAIEVQRFKNQVKRLTEPFYLICGYGETGSMLCRAFDSLGRRFVVLDRDEYRIAELDLADYRADTPALVADAKSPESLVLAGLKHPRCTAVLALTNDDRTNLAIATAGRLLRPDLPLICRAENPQIAADMRLFDAANVIEPFDKIGEYLALAIRSPGSYQLLQWLTGIPGTTLGEQTEPPSGRWVVCGDGYFAGSIARKLRERGLEVGIIEKPGPGRPNESLPLAPSPPTAGLSGLLQPSELERSVGLVAGTDDDSFNLSIVATARKLNPALFFVLRQNLRANQMLFEAHESDISVVSQEIVVHECLAHLTTPLLSRFLQIIKSRDDAWADATVHKLRSKVTRQVPLLWTVDLSPSGAPACGDFCRRADEELRLDHLLRDPGNRESYLPCVALLVARRDRDIEMPGPELRLGSTDRLLFAGTPDAKARQSLTLANVNVLDYVYLGRDVPRGWIWGKLFSSPKAHRSR